MEIGSFVDTYYTEIAYDEYNVVKVNEETKEFSILIMTGTKIDFENFTFVGSDVFDSIIIGLKSKKYKEI